MKRLLLSIILTFLMMAISEISQAKVTGVCSNCHTMHNSQNGQPMLFKSDLDGQPNAALTRGGCIGCHAQNDLSNVKTDIPQVLHHKSGAGGYYGGDYDDLGGGNFRYMLDAGQGTEAGDAKAHNVVGISINPDSKLGNNPPGYDTLFDPGDPKYNTGTRLYCAGSFGCHGDRTNSDQFGAISGGHHESITLGYRFLKDIEGFEHAKWQMESEATRSDHNEYKGSATSATDTTTISYLCGECHGNFHDRSGTGSASPWLRHPTDAVLPPNGEYAGYTTYSLQAPVARKVIAGPTDVVIPGIDIVMCLSCHGAHGSPNFKLMRWDYRGWPPGTNGCNVCHTWKD